MNRRLFWKIFLPFWVAQALLLGALYCVFMSDCIPSAHGGRSLSRQVMPQLGMTPHATTNAAANPHSTNS